MRVAGGTLVIRTIAASATIAAALTIGCASKSKNEIVPWTPDPQVRWDDIAPVPMVFPDEGYQILVTEPTRGLFPATVSITRLAVDVDDERDPARYTRLLRNPRNEVLLWNSALDDQMAIGEVFPVDTRNLGGWDASPMQILAAMNALGAKIGLIYAMNQQTETTSVMIGTLYETATAHPIASVHARAVSIPPPEGEDEPEDYWESDSKALVRAKFEQYVHACRRDLIVQDQPAEIEAPEGWIPARPIRPAVWPPRPGR